MELVYLNSLIENEERIKKDEFNEILTINSININGIDYYVKLDIVLKENYEEINEKWSNSGSEDEPNRDEVFGKYKITILPNMDYFESFSINGEFYLSVLFGVGLLVRNEITSLLDFEVNVNGENILINEEFITNVTNSLSPDNQLFLGE